MQKMRREAKQERQEAEVDRSKIRIHGQDNPRNKGKGQGRSKGSLHQLMAHPPPWADQPPPEQTKIRVVKRSYEGLKILLLFPEQKGGHFLYQQQNAKRNEKIQREIERGIIPHMIIIRGLQIKDVRQLSVVGRAKSYMTTVALEALTCWGDGRETTSIICGVD